MNSIKVVKMGLGLLVVSCSAAWAGGHGGPVGNCKTVGDRPHEVCAVIGETCTVGNKSGICCTNIDSQFKHSWCVCEVGATQCSQSTSSALPAGSAVCTREARVFDDSNSPPIATQ